jgi:segregation and condensation protein A
MRIKNFEQNTLILDNFEGPLAFLHYLVQKSEIDISDISMQKITDQYLSLLGKQQLFDLDAGAEFIDHTGALIWLKSKMLLPGGTGSEDIDELLEKCPFDIIPQLIEYCRFKDMAKQLGHREQGQDAHYPRGMLPCSDDFPKPLGIERIRIDELEALFLELLEKADKKQTQLIREEVYLVSDKMDAIRERLQTKNRFHFRDIFSKEPCREEVVVTFLAILEMMKIGEMMVARELETGKIIIIGASNDESGN